MNEKSSALSTKSSQFSQIAGELSESGSVSLNLNLFSISAAAFSKVCLAFSALSSVNGSTPRAILPIVAIVSLITVINCIRCFTVSFFTFSCAKAGIVRNMIDTTHKILIFITTPPWKEVAQRM